MRADSRRLTTGGADLAYQVSGDPAAPPVLLLHGLGEGAASWAPVVPALAEFFRVIALDLRGHGGSDWPGTYSLELMCSDVLGAADQLGLRKVTLIGHSMGGAVAYLVAIRRPDLVGRLIVEDAPPPYPRDRAVSDRPPGPLDFDWAVVPAIVGEVNRGDPATWDQLAAITAPTLLIGGGAESHVPQHKLAAVAARMPSCELVTIAAGHDVHTADPAEFCRVALRWLQA